MKIISKNVEVRVELECGNREKGPFWSKSGSYGEKRRCGGVEWSGVEYGVVW